MIERRFLTLNVCSFNLQGDIVYLNALGQSMLIVGSYKVAHELLEKRSANYSDRPQSVMAKVYVFSFSIALHAMTLVRLGPGSTACSC